MIRIWPKTGYETLCVMHAPLYEIFYILYTCQIEQKKNVLN